MLYEVITFDKQPRFVTSGIRVGTPAVTSRGLKLAQMEMIANWIERIIESRDEYVLAEIRQEIRDLCKKFPLSAVL